MYAACATSRGAQPHHVANATLTCDLADNARLLGVSGQLLQGRSSRNHNSMEKHGFSLYLQNFGLYLTANNMTFISSSGRSGNGGKITFLLLTLRHLICAFFPISD